MAVAGGGRGRDDGIEGKGADAGFGAGAVCCSGTDVVKFPLDRVCAASGLWFVGFR